ncbi:DNA/RNA helicase superfamily I [Salisediminibacterium halotolerans]|nr:DNA/RNA helicase superfamily I [Salisediminibacterium halotolerans]
MKSEGKVLYLTYTRNNLKSMKNDIASKPGGLSESIECRTWIEFLFNEMAKPYRKMVKMPLIEGLDDTLESKIPKRKGLTSNSKGYYINRNNHLYSERLAQFVDVINKIINGRIYNRIEKIYSTVLIDEVQDLNGYDLEIIRNIYNLSCNVIIVGDHRQSTYSTNTSRKHSIYKNDKIFNFFIKEMGIEHLEQLEVCYRCNQEICDFVNALYDDLKLIEDPHRERQEDEGIVKLNNQQELLNYTKNYSPTILYYNVKTLNKLEKLGVPRYLEQVTFGKAKGITRQHVLIFPTKDMKNKMYDWSVDLKGQTLAKFYVAMTRARYSVAIYLG